MDILLHILGTCGDSHAHIDLSDIPLYCGHMSTQLSNWKNINVGLIVKQLIK